MNDFFTSTKSVGTSTFIWISLIQFTLANDIHKFSPIFLVNVINTLNVGKLKSEIKIREEIAKSAQERESACSKERRGLDSVT